MLTNNRFRRFSGLFGAGALAVLASACAPMSPPAGNVENGKALSLQWCGSCHRLGIGMAQELEGRPLGPDFTGVKWLDANRLKQRLTSNHPVMPKFPGFSDPQTADVAAYINSLQK